jgi:hypothetical protein
MAAMALRREYDNEVCAIARWLEVIGERWTLLIIRDAVYGVTRFSDFWTHLVLPPAVLTERLRLLVEHDIMTTSVAASGRDEPNQYTSRMRRPDRVSRGSSPTTTGRCAVGSMWSSPSRTWLR